MRLKVHLKQTTQSACTWESLVFLLYVLDNNVNIMLKNFVAEALIW